MPDLEKAKLCKKSKSVCPKGLTLQNAARRLSEIPQDKQAKDAEHIMMNLWEEENTRQSHLNFGKTPIDTVLHECNEKCGDKLAIFSLVGSRHFFGGKFAERDLRVASATVQWLATNCGREFYSRFLEQLKVAHKPKEGLEKSTETKAQ